MITVIAVTLLLTVIAAAATAKRPRRTKLKARRR
ncbi:MAG: hypothetical protein JWM77_855 [Rhodospirillales bacterium]|jgi:hypothetical protein|nr:hypothetical protein [Rhodospirillales bacterium]